MQIPGCRALGLRPVVLTLVISLQAVVPCAVPSFAQSHGPAGASSGSAKEGSAAKSFDQLADAALLTMRRRAAELNVSGVAVVAYFEGDHVEAWSSKMSVVGRMKDLPTSTDKGINLVAIAYSKAAEMADTLKDSGSQVRAPMTGEFGWSGGVIVKGNTGYLIAAFSGGKSEDDVLVSRAGVKELSGGAL